MNVTTFAMLAANTTSEYKGAVFALIATLGAALISGGVTLIVCLINNKMQMRKSDMEQDKRMAETAHQHELSMAQMQASIQENLAIITTTIENLTSEVREHNNFARRMPVVEEKVSRLENEIRDIKSNQGKKRRSF